MTSEFPVLIERVGSIEVEAVSGVVTEQFFVLDLTLREKRVEAEIICDNPTLIALRVGPSTLRASRDGESYETLDPNAPGTLVKLPLGWSTAVSVSRYTCRIHGVKFNGPEFKMLPFSVDPEGKK